MTSVPRLRWLLRRSFEGKSDTGIGVAKHFRKVSKVETMSSLSLVSSLVRITMIHLEEVSFSVAS